MAKPRIAAKYTGQHGEFYNHIPARDLNEDEFDALPDEHKALLAESSFYSLRHEAPAEAEKAGRRAAKAEKAGRRAAKAEPAVDAPFMAPAPIDADGEKK